MTVRSFTHVLAFALTATVLLACGDNQPIANQLVTGHYDDDANSELRGSEPSAPEAPSQPRVAPPAGHQTLYDAVVKQGVPKTLAELTFKNYDKHVSRVKNPNYIVMIDYSVHSSKKRFYLVNATTGKVEPTVVAHGSGSDPSNTGYAKYFSNTEGSLMTSLGSYIISEKYYSEKFEEAIRLDGLDSTNSRARERAIVMHGADYVNEGSSKQGRSWGCPALTWNWRDKVYKILPGGSFMYLYGIPGRMSPKMLQAHLQRMTDLSALATGRTLSESEDAPFAGE